MWSLGCILYEMCVLRPPFMARNFKELRRSVLIGAFPPLPPFYSEELNLLVKALLQMDPQDRPSAEELLQSPYMNKKGRKILDVKLERTAEEPKRSLMRTIKMKDLASLRQALPGPNYKPEENRGVNIESAAKLKLDERHFRNRTEDSSIQLKVKSRLIANSGLASADGGLSDRRDELIKAKILPSKNHFNIKVKSHQVSVNNSLADDADFHVKRERMPEIKEAKNFEQPRGKGDPPIKSRRIVLDAPIKQNVSLDIQIPSLSRPASRNVNEPNGFLPKFPRKIITSNLLNQKKSIDFKLNRERDGDVIDQLVGKKDSARGNNKGIWATEDPRTRRMMPEDLESKVDIPIDRVALPEDIHKDLFSRRKHRNIS